MERAKIVLDWDGPSPASLKGYFADIFSELDARPRPLMVSVTAFNERHMPVSIAFEDGEPVFRIKGHPDARADFRGRWLPEHPVPLRLPEYGTRKLVLTPTDGNRVKVRLATFWERIFG